MSVLSSKLSNNLAKQLAQLALDCVDREYPNHILHLLESDKDVGTPSSLTPVFFGCFDWHSAVHGHWTLVRLLRVVPDLETAAKCRDVLNAHFTSEKIAGEADYIGHPSRTGFERPYGLAWLLQLVMECRAWQDSDAQVWAERLRPIEDIAAKRFMDWLPKLAHPVRSGEHSQTAFALGLVWDWAVANQRESMVELLTQCAQKFYGSDKNAPLSYEPSGHDFLSPAIAEVDFMRRVLPPAEFSSWLAGFLPGLDDDAETDWLIPVKVSDASDGKLAHLDGLNLSRAWMLNGIASALPDDDPRRTRLLNSAEFHSSLGLESVTGEHYAGGHWLGSFAVYLLTQRGLGSSNESQQIDE